jgi:DNA-binding SARP family transcriptional activator
LLAARFALDCGNEPEAIKLLRATLPRGRERGFALRDGWLAEPMTRLYSCALKHGVETAHIQELIRQAPGAFSSPPPQLDAWPWPLKVHALGRFTVFLDGKPIQFSTKAQKKPLELLKALLALGGKQVREDKTAEALWPDADADDAARSLTSTIHRLRQLIGEECIDRQQGLLTLNPARCWTDLWAVQRLLTQLDTAYNEKSVHRVADLTQSIVKLYGGGFLDGDTDAGWALGMRERVRAKVLRQLETAARFLFESEHQELAIDRFQRALEIDPLAEGLYGGLMQSYLSLRRSADALLTYDRCCESLRRDLGVKPSPEIERLKQRAYADAALR